MKRRDKWILIVVIIGSLACGIAPIAYFAVWAFRDLNMMEARRPVLLYETDHKALLEACRELSRQVAAGKLEPGIYYELNPPRDPQTRQFPQLILDLLPLHVDVKKNGLVDIVMSPVVMYGLFAYPENYEGTPSGDLFEYGDKLWGIELIDGLWYYDEKFRKHPENMKEVEELLKKRKAGEGEGSWTLLQNS